MRKLIILILFISSSGLFAQNIERVEYFFDIDPGYGNATEIAITPANQLELDLLVPMDDMDNGFHILYVRALDENGNWSNNFIRSFLKENLQSDVLPNVTSLEYFINTDPGYGNGTAIDIASPSAIMELSFTVDLTDMPNGYHTIYFRAKDAYGNWSMVLNRPFVVGINVPDVTYVEYFYDTDPGFGNATPIDFVVFNRVNLSVNLNLAEAESGFHTLYVRAKDANGSWSQTFIRSFIKESLQSDNLPNVVKAEYFVDEDPGYGLGTNIAIENPSYLTVLDFIADVTGYEEGNHIFYARAQDENGNWSIVYSEEFEICTGPEQPNLPVGEIQLCINSENTVYTTNEIVDAIAYEWHILPEEAGTISVTDTVGTVDWNDDFVGTAEIFVNAINDCSAGLSSDTLEVIVFPYPVAYAGENTSICEGEIINLIATGGTDYLWSTDETNDSIAVSPLQTTIYSVTVSENGCSDSAEVTVTVNPVYLIQEEATICEEDSLLWEGTYYLEAGTYDTTFISIFGCDSVRELTLNIAPNYFVQEQETICEGDSILWHGEYYSVAGSYYDNQTTTFGCDSIFELILQENPVYFFEETDSICEGESYNWQGNAYDVAGTYSAEYTSEFACDSIYQLELIVKPLPVASFTFTSNELEITFTNTSINASSYLWDFGDSNTETAENPVYTYASSGDYSVVLTAYSDYCGEVTDTQSLSITTGINSIEFGDIARIYPNPSKGIFYFVANSNLNNNLIVKIIDVNGQVIYINYQITKTIEKIDLSNYAKGIYFIQVRSDKYSSTEKIILE